MEKVIKHLGKAEMELDYLFQNGVIFSKKDVKEFDAMMERLQKIRKDPFFYIDSLPKI